MGSVGSIGYLETGADAYRTAHFHFCAVGGLVSEITTMTDFSNLKPTDRLPRREAAEYLGNTYNTLTVWASQKKGPPFYKTGKKCLYKVADLDAFMESRRVSFEPVPL